MEDFIKGMIETIFNSGDISQISSRINSIMSTDKLYQTFNAISDQIIIIGSFFMLLYFLINISESFKIERFTPQIVFAAFLKMVIALYVIEVIQDNFIKLLDIEDGFMSLFGEFNSSTNNTALIDETIDSFRSSTNQFSMLPSLIAIIQLIIPWVGAVLLNMYIHFVFISRQVNLVLRILFAPIAMAGIANGFTSYSINYIKKFIALLMQVGIISATMSIVNLINVGIAGIGETGFTGGIGLVIMQVTIIAAAAALIGQSLKFSEELLGV